MKISARNQINGTVLSVTPGAVNGTVKVDIGGGNVITSSITEEAIADLGLAGRRPGNGVHQGERRADREIAMRIGALKLKAQLYCGDELAMGPGKADLLEAIDREGSISAAGRALGMSYRRTWMLVDSMNRCWRDRLVETVAGGGSAKGARLSDAGRAVLAAYRALEARLAVSAEGAPLGQLGEMLRDVPLPPSHG